MQPVPPSGASPPYAARPSNERFEPPKTAIWPQSSPAIAAERGVGIAVPLDQLLPAMS